MKSKSISMSIMIFCAEKYLSSPIKLFCLFLKKQKHELWELLCPKLAITRNMIQWTPTVQISRTSIEPRSCQIFPYFANHYNVQYLAKYLLFYHFWAQNFLNFWWNIAILCHDARPEVEALCQYDVDARSFMSVTWISLVFFCSVIIFFVILNLITCFIILLFFYFLFIIRFSKINRLVYTLLGLSYKDDHTVLWTLLKNLFFCRKFFFHNVCSSHNSKNAATGYNVFSV